jgi:hypothetical protein
MPLLAVGIPGGFTNTVSGLLDCDWDAAEWYDWDETCHGPIDTEEHKREYPDGFMWDCCGKSGTRRGCTRGKHRESDTRKQLRSNGMIRAQALPESMPPSNNGSLNQNAVRQARNLPNAEDGDASSLTIDSDSALDDVTTTSGEDEDEENQEDV